MFTVRGKIRGKAYSVTYDDGKLTGDTVAVTVVSVRAAIMEGRTVGPIGQYTMKNHLATPLSALFIMQLAFTSIDAVAGDIPTAAEVPDGAVC